MGFKGQEVNPEDGKDEPGETEISERSFRQEGERDGMDTKWEENRERRGSTRRTKSFVSRVFAQNLFSQ